MTLPTRLDEAPARPAVEARSGTVPSETESPSLHAAARACDQAADDWELLFPAMVARLQALIEAAPGAVEPGNVHDCQLAMEQLHGLVLQERDLRRRIESELKLAQAALATARIELDGTRDVERQVRHLAEHDSLTALPNRDVYHRRLQALLDGTAPPTGRERGDGVAVVGRQGTQATAEPATSPPALAVLFVDLDGFKPVNDRHGHATGDELLRVVAQRLSRSIRAGDLVCRLGGDEFACIVVEPGGTEQLRERAAKLFDAVSAPLRLGPLLLNVRPSIGIAVCPQDGTDADTLLRRADSAMYRAKRQQSGWAFYERAVP